VLFLSKTTNLYFVCGDARREEKKSRRQRDKERQRGANKQTRDKQTLKSNFLKNQTSKKPTKKKTFPKEKQKYLSGEKTFYFSHLLLFNQKKHNRDGFYASQT
jgi:hypothetical protein